MDALSPNLLHAGPATHRTHATHATHAHAHARPHPGEPVAHAGLAVEVGAEPGAGGAPPLATAVPTLDRPALTSPLGHTHTAACEDADSKPARCGSSFMFVPAISNLR